MDQIIPLSGTSLNPAAKTITLPVPFDTIKLSQIKLITNITKKIDIYNSKNPRSHTAPKGVAGPDISILNGVITYVEDATMENTDEIQIIADISDYSLSKEVDLFTNEAVAASTSVSSNIPLYVGQLSKMKIYCSNAGPSTSVTVDIYTSPTNSTTGRKSYIATFTLGAGTVETPDEAGNGVDPKQLDDYCWGVIKNSDTVNAADITITFKMFR